MDAGGNQRSGGNPADLDAAIAAGQDARFILRMYWDEELPGRDELELHGVEMKGFDRVGKVVLNER